VNCSQSSRSPRIADASSNSWSSSGSLRFGANIGFLITAAFISPSNADNKKYRDAKATRSAPGSRCQTSANRIDRPFDALGVHRVVRYLMTRMAKQVMGRRGFHRTHLKPVETCPHYSQSEGSGTVSASQAVILGPDAA
jgi:hypothetical protein